MCLCIFGHPLSVNQCTVNRIGSFCVLFAVLVSRLLGNAEMDIASTQRSSLICELFAHDDGKWLSASASNISLPGRYVMAMSYCYRCNSILCKWTGAEVKFFKLIISSGLWSVSTIKDLLYKYMWNFLQPKRLLAVPSRCSHTWFLYQSSFYLRMQWAYCLELCMLLYLSVICKTPGSPVYFCHSTSTALIIYFPTNLLFSGSCHSHFGPMWMCSPFQQDSQWFRVDDSVWHEYLQVVDCI